MLRLKLLICDLFLISVLTLCNAPPVFSFPEMIGAGYHKCSSCHMETAGGGPLNAYGKGVSESISTWSYEGEGDTYYGYFGNRPSLLDIHADFRHLAYRYEDNEVRVTTHFPMQREVSLSIHATKTLSAVISCGQYGYGYDQFNLGKSAQCRRYFFSHRGDLFGLRAGRFLPAFGMNIPDHTKAIKQLFQQGRETLNYELSAAGKFGELVYTRAYKNDSDKDLGLLTASEMDAQIIKASAFIMRGLQVGYSVARFTRDGGRTIDQVESFHAFLGGESLALQGEYQNHPEGEVRAYGMAGVRPFRGVWLKAELDHVNDENELFGTLQLLPRPHYEFVFSASQKRYMLISHLYL